MRARPTIFGAIARVVLTAAVLLAAAGSQANAASDPGAVVARPPALPSGANEVMKLHSSGTPADIIVSYIADSPLSFYLSADDIIYLEQQGVPSDVIRAMLQRCDQLRRQTTIAASAPAPARAPAQSPAPQYYPSYAPVEPARSYPCVVTPCYPFCEPFYNDSFWYIGYPSHGLGAGLSGASHAASAGHGAVAHGGSGGSVGHAAAPARTARRR
ncbi:MAG: hypothetical protein ABSA47_01235 [Verrucomicrobiota bacterium]|jgi:hypothetical protein